MFRVSPAHRHRLFQQHSSAVDRSSFCCGCWRLFGLPVLLLFNQQRKEDGAGLGPSSQLAEGGDRPLGGAGHGADGHPVGTFFGPLTPLWPQVTCGISEGGGILGQTGP